MDCGASSFGLAVVVLITPQGKVLRTTTAGIEMPHALVDEYRKRYADNPELTLGDVMREHHGGDPTDLLLQL